MKFVLKRLETGDQGTFGRLTGGGFDCFTGELPWRDNAPSISCIPPGRYRGLFTMSPRFKRKLYLLVPTDPRTGIRIHSANLMGDAAMGYKSQLNGCISMGERLGWIDGQKAVLLSMPAVRRFETLTGGSPFDLEIENG